MKMIYKAAECEVKTENGFNVTIGDFCPEAVGYALCRLFARSMHLRSEFVPMSYAMRLASGKGRKAVRRRCVIPAFLAELEGELLQIDLTVDGSGVTIRSVRQLFFD